MDQQRRQRCMQQPEEMLLPMQPLPFVQPFMQPFILPPVQPFIPLLTGSTEQEDEQRQMYPWPQQGQRRKQLLFVELQNIEPPKPLYKFDRCFTCLFYSMPERTSWCRANRPRVAVDIGL